MGVEGGNLVDLRHRQLHFLAQCAKVSRGQAAIMILDQVQVLDQQVTTARLVAQKRFDF